MLFAFFLIPLAVLARPGKSDEAPSPISILTEATVQALKPVYHPSAFPNAFFNTQAKSEVEVEKPDVEGANGKFDVDSSIVTTESSEESAEQQTSLKILKPHTDISVSDKPILIATSDNDSPAEVTDAPPQTTEGPSQPICTAFQYTVLGDDLSQKTFPRISYVSSEALPYRVHYAPDDELHYESYKWPFAACNRACELQALAIRALFDTELDPENKNSRLDDNTKENLLISREICQWKNAQRLFRIPQSTGHSLRKRDESTDGEVEQEEQPKQPLKAKEQEKPQKLVEAQPFRLSSNAQLALYEIRGIFESAFGPEDLQNLFHTVSLACQIHCYTKTPMRDLTISSLDRMVHQAMAQVEKVFADTQGHIDVWETRDAIVRATQIYRYQEEQARGR